MIQHKKVITSNIQPLEIFIMACISCFQNMKLNYFWELVGYMKSEATLNQIKRNKSYKSPQADHARLFSKRSGTMNKTREIQRGKLNNRKTCIRYWYFSTCYCYQPKSSALRTQPAHYVNYNLSLYRLVFRLLI